MNETTALGAALAAGLAVGVWDSVNDFQPSAALSTFNCTITDSGFVEF